MAEHTTPCFRYVYLKVVRFRCIRSNGNARKRHETGNGNTGYPSCFRNGLTCFCHVSVYGFLQFRPVQIPTASFPLPPSHFENILLVRNIQIKIEQITSRIYQNSVLNFNCPLAHAIGCIENPISIVTDPI